MDGMIEAPSTDINTISETLHNACSFTVQFYTRTSVYEEEHATQRVGVAAHVSKQFDSRNCHFELKMRSILDRKLHKK